MHQPAADLPPVFKRGDLFLDRYRIYSLLGAGGFGQVYYACDSSVRQEVAVKISMRSPLSQEGKLLSSVFHAQVPQAYDWGEAREGWYLIMQYIRGKSLYDLIKEAQAEGHGVPVEEVYSIGIQLCRVLADLHEHQPPIIFRDLKPKNIMLTATDQLYLVDFGIACLDPRHCPLPRRQALFGTPGYLAPEVLHHQHVSPAMDIYALGKTLHQLLTGRLGDPCTCKSSPCVCGSYPLTTLRGPLGSLVMQLLACDVRFRPSDAGELREILQELLDLREAGCGEEEPETWFGRLRFRVKRYLASRPNVF
jgi:serine/threonine protein kinase